MSRRALVVLFGTTGALLVVALAVVLAVVRPFDGRAGSDPGDAAARGAVTPSPSAEAQEEAPAPDACGAVPLDEDAAIPGDALGACLEAIIAMHGSFRATVTSDDGTVQKGKAQREPFRLELDDPGSTLTEARITADAAWGRIDGRWVKGSFDSEDGDAATVQVAAEAARAFYFSTATWAYVRTAPTWHAEQRSDLVDADGVKHSGWRFTPDTPTSALGVTSTESAIDVTDGFTILGTSHTSTGYGVTTSGTQRYADWGRELSFRDLPG
jgi:hypothetical protein